jgi:hypothetical protein
MKFLGKVIEKFGDGEYVQYSIRYEDGDEEKFVKRAFITPIDLNAMRTSQPKWRRRLTSNNIISSNADNQADNQGSAIMLSSNEDNDIVAAAVAVNSPATTTSATAAGGLLSKEEEEGDEVVINHSWQPLQVGTQIMAAPRGLDKWYSGVIVNIRSGKLNLNAIDKNKNNNNNNDSKKNSKNKDKNNHKQQLQWLYDIHYPFIEAGGKTVVQVSSDVIENDVCAGLVAPVLQRE